MMEENTTQPNMVLAKICENLFYNPASNLCGSVGIKNLGNVMSMPSQEFEASFPITMQEEELGQ